MDVVKSRTASPWRLFYFFALPFSLAIVLSSIFFYCQLKVAQKNYLTQELKASANHLQQSANFILTDIMSDLGRFSLRWEKQHGMTESFWYFEANAIYRDAKVYSGIVYIDNTYHIRYLVPEANASLIGFDITQNVELYNLFKLAAANHENMISPIRKLISGKLGFIVIQPLYLQQNFQGFINAGIEIDKFMSQMFPTNEVGDFGFAIYQGKNLVYSNNLALNNRALLQKVTLHEANIEWEFQVWPTQAMLNKFSSNLPNIALESGLAIAIFFLLTFLFYTKAQINEKRSIETKRQADLIAMRFTNVLDAVNEGLIAVDKDGKILFINSYAEHLFKRKNVAVLQKNAFDLLFPERVVENYKQYFSEFISKKHSELMNRDLELMAIDKDKNEFPIEAIILPLLEYEEYVFYIFIRDITLRKKAEKELIRYVSMVNATDDSIISLDLQGKILTWNNAAERIYGFKAEEMIGQSFAIILNGKEQELAEILHKISNGEHVGMHDASRRDKQGRIIPLSVRITPIYSAMSNIIGIVSVGRDLTEGKKIDKIKNQFLSVVAYELKTPLSSIRGSLSIILNDKLFTLETKIRELLGIANTNCERLIHIVNDVIDIEKIELGKMPFNFTKIDLNELAYTAILAFRSQALEQQIELELKNSRTYYVLADRERLLQVMNNLLINAIRFAEPHTIVTVALAKQGNFVRLGVTNLGSKIAEELQEKIFQKFLQLDPGINSQLRGTGLSLAISKALIEAMHGIMAMQSHTGRGTTFYFDLPEVEVNPAELAAIHSFKDIKKLQADTQKSIVPNILNIDSDKEVSNALTNLLQKSACVWNAPNLAAARALLEKVQFSLIIFEKHLVDGDGTSLLPCIDTRTGQPIPAILFANSDAIDAETQAFVVAFLKKNNTTNEQLVETIRRFLKPTKVGTTENS